MGLLRNYNDYSVASLAAPSLAVLDGDTFHRLAVQLTDAMD